MYYCMGGVRLTGGVVFPHSCCRPFTHLIPLTFLPMSEQYRLPRRSGNSLFPQRQQPAPRDAELAFLEFVTCQIWWVRARRQRSQKQRRVPRQRARVLHLVLWAYILQRRETPAWVVEVVLTRRQGRHMYRLQGEGSDSPARRRVARQRQGVLPVIAGSSLEH